MISLFVCFFLFFSFFLLLSISAGSGTKLKGTVVVVVS